MIINTLNLLKERLGGYQLIFNLVAYLAMTNVILSVLYFLFTHMLSRYRSSSACSECYSSLQTLDRAISSLLMPHTWQQQIPSVHNQDNYIPVILPTTPLAVGLSSVLALLVLVMGQ